MENKEIKVILDRAKNLKYKCDCCEEILPGKYVMRDDKQTDNLIEAVYIIDKLLDYITNLQEDVRVGKEIIAEYKEENERLKNGYCELKVKCNNGECDCTNEEYDGMVESNMKLSLEVDRLNNIIEELEKHLIAMSKIYEEEYKDIDTSEHYKSMLNKLKELKGERSE